MVLGYEHIDVVIKCTLNIPLAVVQPAVETALVKFTAKQLPIDCVGALTQVGPIANPPDIPYSSSPTSTEIYSSYLSLFQNIDSDNCKPTCTLVVGSTQGF